MNSSFFIKRFCVAVFLFLLFVQVHAQTNYSPTREKQLDKLGQKGVTAVFLKPDSALMVSEQLLKMKDIELYPKALSKAYRIKGIYYYQTGDFAKALGLFYSQKLYAEKAKDTSGVIAGYNNIGLMYINMGSYQRALETLFEAKKIVDSTNLRSSENSIINNIALTHEKLGNDSLALRYYLITANQKDSLIDPPGFSTTLNNIGWQYVKLKKYKIAHNYLERSFRLAKRFNYHYIMILSQINMAELHARSKNYEIARELHLSSIDMARNAGENELYAVAIFNMGDLLFNRLKKPAQGIRLTLEAFDSVSARASLPDMRDFSGQLASFYERINDMDNAVKYYKMHIRFKDSLSRELNNLALTEMLVMHDVENKQRSIDALNKKNEEQKQKTEAQEQKARLLQYAVIIGLVVVCIIIFLILNRYRLKQKANKKLSEAYQAVEEKNKEIRDSINYAKRIQEAILPAHHSILQSLHNGFVIFKPKDVVSGDFYWLENAETSQGTLVFFAAADCTGHGVPGALVSVICSNALSKALLEENITETGKLLDRTRELVIQRFAKSGENVKDGMDISLCAYNPKTKTLQWSGANNPLWIVRNAELTEYKPDKQPIGQFTSSTPFKTHTIQLQANDTLYIFTDGYADQFGGPAGKKFKASSLKKLLVSLQHHNMPQQHELILKAFEHWKNDREQIDDVCMIGVRI